ncbi:hypothetical protein ACFV7O_21685 [Streptomyces tendae]|uniref:hypothetical protein n=1 Tax=Streptomyces tendae TaxID=1932 RepID=UPI00365C6D61
MSDDHGYSSWHGFLKRFKLKANYHACTWCGIRAEHWSYDWSRPDIERRDPRGRVYAEDTGAYQPMCARCHRTFDAAYRRLGREALAGAIPQLAVTARARISDERRAWAAEDIADSRKDWFAYEGDNDPGVRVSGMPSKCAACATHDLLVSAYANE